MHKREGTQEHRCARSEWRCGAAGFYVVVAATAGMRAGAVGVVSLCSAPQLSALRQWHGYWVVFLASRRVLFSFLSSQTRMPPDSSLTTRQFQRRRRYVLLCTSLRMFFWFEGDAMCCGFSLYGSCIFVGVFLHELFCQAEFHSLVVTRHSRDKSLHPLKSDCCFGWRETLSMAVAFALL